MSCDATTQGDEMYCSRCQLRWATSDPAPRCLPVERRKVNRSPTPAVNTFNARKFALQHRGFITNPAVLDVLEQAVRAAYAAGVKK